MFWKEPKKNVEPILSPEIETRDTLDRKWCKPEVMVTGGDANRKWGQAITDGNFILL